MDRRRGDRRDRALPAAASSARQLAHGYDRRHSTTNPTILGNIFGEDQFVKAYLPIDIQGGATDIVLRQPGGAIRTIGIIDDNLNPPFMRELVEALGRQLPDGQVRVWVKPRGTAPG